YVAAAVVLVFGLEKQAVLQSELIFGLSVNLKAVQVIVRPNTPITLVVQIDGIGKIAELAKLAGQFALAPGRKINRVGAGPEAILLEQFGVFLVGHILTERSSTDRGKQVGQQ